MKRIVYFSITNRIAIIFITYILSGIKPFYDFLLIFGHRWDGNSYTFIATNGYVAHGSGDVFIVFPPLYPFLIKIVSSVGIDPTLSGVIISNIFFVLGMVVLYRLVESVWDKKIALLSVILISIFPTTYFFSVAYPESFFIFLFSLSFYFAHKKSFLLSAFIGGLAAITRPFGLVILVPIFLFMFNAKKLSFKNILLTSLLFALPIIPYIWINYALYGNPLEFTDVLKQNWQKSFDFPWNGILSSWERGIFSTDSYTYKYFVGYGEAIASTLAWVATFLGIKKWGIKSPYLIYLFLGTVFFTSTGFILSAPRYLLSIPPFFILLAEILSRNKIVKFTWFGISLILLVWFSHEFALGNWAF